MLDDVRVDVLDFTFQATFQEIIQFSSQLQLQVVDVGTLEQLVNFLLGL